MKEKRTVERFSRTQQQLTPICYTTKRNESERVRLKSVQIVPAHFQLLILTTPVRNHMYEAYPVTYRSKSDEEELIHTQIQVR